VCACACVCSAAIRDGVSPLSVQLTDEYANEIYNGYILFLRFITQPFVFVFSFAVGVRVSVGLSAFKEQELA